MKYVYIYIEFIKFACVLWAWLFKSGRDTHTHTHTHTHTQSHASEAGQNPHMDIALCSMHTQRLGNLLNLERAWGNGKYTI
jgi:hypothetical protein